LKILFISENFPPETNAAASRVFERACYWVAWGHEVTVITSAPNFPAGKLFAGYKNRFYQTEVMSKIRVIRVKTFIAPNRGFFLRTLDFLSFMVNASVAGLFQKRSDVVVATSPQFFAAVCGWFLGRAKKMPFVFELGDLWPASIEAVGAMKSRFLFRLLERLELFLYRQATAIAALTLSFKENLVERGIEADKISVVINGVDLSRYEPREKDQDLAEHWGLNNRFVVGYVGTQGMAHALSNLLDAAERLKGRDDVCFLLAGGGAEHDHLVANAARRGLTNVVFMPPQPKKQMARVWSLCDVALVHLKNSPVFAGVIPSKIFEAMGMGLPLLLAAPEGEASRIIKNAEAGLCVEAENPDALASVVLQFAEDENLRRRFAKNSLAAAPLHSRERQAKEMIQVLDSASAHNQAHERKAP
jgi:colanic acid biosynthesis glycosyl transferase WcaI